MKLQLSITRAQILHDLLVAAGAFAVTFAATASAGDPTVTSTWIAAAAAGATAAVKALARVVLPGVVK